jgi:hypothetical protein
MVKVAPVGDPPSAEEPEGAANESAAVGGADGADGAAADEARKGVCATKETAAALRGDGAADEDRVSSRPPSTLSSAFSRGYSSGAPSSRRYGQMVEKYEALLSKVTKRSKRAKLMSVQGVLFGFTFMMSTFETSNR